MKPVTLYTTPTCPFCVRTKMLLNQKGVAYEEVDLAADDVKRAELEKKTGRMTVPMIFIGEEFIGGFDELNGLEQKGELDAKLND